MGEDSWWTIPMPSLVIVVSAFLVFIGRTDRQTNRQNHRITHTHRRVGVIKYRDTYRTHTHTHTHKRNYETHAFKKCSKITTQRYHDSYFWKLWTIFNNCTESCVLLDQHLRSWKCMYVAWCSWCPQYSLSPVVVDASKPKPPDHSESTANNAQPPRSREDQQSPQHRKQRTVSFCGEIEQLSYVHIWQ